MNVGIVTSFVIGGLMLISVLAFNNSVMNSTIETTTSVIAQNKIDDLVTVLTNDISRLGYNTGTADNFLINTGTTMKFKGDIFDGDETKNLDYDVVVWTFSNTAAGSTTNPNDYILTRTWDPTPNGGTGDEEISTYTVTHFELKYFNGQGQATTDPNVIKQIEIEIVQESGEPYYTNRAGEANYYRSVWKRTIIPNNLMF
ncbi:hypothetical protein [Balneola vulgaris]|uniref:hypothetical protein n=1 Tax=Balneola vulgaris TaxID=287535 RepID=UPI0003601CF2|nr:hypothetical protein [Balneola vulgaris]